MPKITREKFKTLHNVFDAFTERNIFKLISQGYFDGLESPIFIGKEANVFTALKGRKRVIVKIYRLQNCDFNRMYDYIKYDPRFPKQRRKTVFAWAQREYRNLLKARDSGVRVPTPITCVHNILVMEYIGDEEPAPKIKDSLPKKTDKFFDAIILGIRKLYKAGLIHADLSQFNILNYKEKPVFIDMSQATPLEDPNAMKYLERDIKNICNFFKKRGVNAKSEDIRQKIVR